MTRSRPIGLLAAAVGCQGITAFGGGWYVRSAGGNEITAASAWSGGSNGY
jgi:hypothetical protein